VYATLGLLAAQSGDLPGARRYVNQSIELIEMLRRMVPSIAVESRLLLSRALLLLGDLATARMFVRQADMITQRIPDFEAVEQMVLDVRAAIHHPAATVPGAEPLTTSELRMLRYLASPLSIQTIGHDLELSPNIVNTQVRSVYRKLRVYSRSAAIDATRHLGLLPGIEAEE
jgi:ATP/maltotriose-dependent transcriptional regulator MalT